MYFTDPKVNTITGTNSKNDKNNECYKKYYNLNKVYKIYLILITYKIWYLMSYMFSDNEPVKSFQLSRKALRYLKEIKPVKVYGGKRWMSLETRQWDGRAEQSLSYFQ